MFSHADANLSFVAFFRLRNDGGNCALAGLLAASSSIAKGSQNITLRKSPLSIVNNSPTNKQTSSYQSTGEKLFSMEISTSLFLVLVLHAI